jgi:hypothetical protein
MYIEFLLSGLNVKDVGQAFIDKCRQRMPLAILGQCSIKETLAGFILPSAYTGVYNISNQQEVRPSIDDELRSTRMEHKHYNNTPHSRDSEEILHSW